jgi:hypothetical protein
VLFEAIDRAYEDALCGGSLFLEEGLLHLGGESDVKSGQNAPQHIRSVLHSIDEGAGACGFSPSFSPDGGSLSASPAHPHHNAFSKFSIPASSQHYANSSASLHQGGAALPASKIFSDPSGFAGSALLAGDSYFGDEFGGDAGEASWEGR